MFIGLLGMQTNKKKANYIEVYFYSFNLSCFQVSALLVTKMDKNYRLSIWLFTKSKKNIETRNSWFKSLEKISPNTNKIYKKMWKIQSFDFLAYQKLIEQKYYQTLSLLLE